MVKARRKKRSKAIRGAVLSFLIFLLALAAVFLVVRIRSRTPGREAARHVRPATPGRASPPTSADSLERFGLAIQKAGGENVWVRRGPPSSTAALDVLILPRAYPQVEQAILRSAQEQDLQVQLPGARLRTSLRTILVTSYFGKREVCRWTMRQVPRIPRVAIVVDDLGQNLAQARELLRLHSPLTFSVMPRLRYSRETADEAHQAGIEVMLHLPMQPLKDSAPDVSAQELKVGMGSPEVERIIQDDLASVPFVAGVNNHMGSRATRDPYLMSEVMAVLAAHHLYYIDSRTIGGSVALKLARRSGLRAFYRSVFLDDTRTIPYTLDQLRQLCRVAQRQGVALAIGHPYPSTIAALGKFLPQLETENIQLVRVSKLLSFQEVARLSPPAPPSITSKQRPMQSIERF